MTTAQRDRIRPLRAYAASASRTAALLWRRQLTHPRRQVGRTLVFADGSRSVVYRETVRLGAVTTEPTVLVVQFRLRLIGRSRLLHAVFRVESMAHTPLFAGFPGFRSKLWATDLKTGVYRGIYQWDGVDRAVDYAETLCPLLEVLSEPDTVSYHIEPGTLRDEFLAEPRQSSGGPADRWWVVSAA